jgi:predicted lipid-binding transport protein (Tim44 family)
MERFVSGAVAALVIFLQLILPVSPGFAAPPVIAQSETQAAPAAGAPPAADAKPGPTPAQAPATPGASVSAPATKSALSITACSVKYLEAKVAGKLNGRKWVDFRRDECGQKDTTAVFPTAIAPKYAGEKDLDKALTKTCADQFTANKPSNANGGLKWVEKDGGYYAECISRLKDG